MSEIKFRINSVSSEHNRYPAGNLTINQEGWQSAINCTYPQSITIQFYVPIRTKKLHVLFHQYKIPKLIEVFVKLGSRENYRKLGYVIPNDNSQSSYQQKEEKTLYFQFSCTHIRFVLHENYKNDVNIFNQVAIEDLIVLGEILSHREIGEVDLNEQVSSEEQVTESIEISHNERSLNKQENDKGIQNNSGQTLSLFKDIYEKLQAEKQEAVAHEEYQRAAQFKNILVNFKNIQNEIIRLERQKADALKNEDYDRCHKIKTEINKKRQMVQYQKYELFKNEEQFYSHNSYSRIIQKQVSPLNESKRKENPVKDVLQFRSPEVDRKVNPANPSMNLHDEQVLPAILNRGKPPNENLPLQTNQKKRQLFMEVNQSLIPEQPAQNDSASLKKDINEIRQLTDRQGESIGANESFRLELEPLDSKLRMRVQNYFTFIPEKVWQFCENKHWKGKLEAVKYIKDKVPEIQTKEQFMATLEMVSRIIVSKQAVISIEALQILSRLTEVNLKFTLQHMPFFVQDIINQLLNFLNDTNSKIKELAYNTYYRLPKISFLNISVVIRELIKHKNKVKNDPKLVITKIQLMTMIVESYRDFEYNFKEIINWMLNYLEDPNQKVRNTAGELLVALAFVVGGDKVIKTIESLNKPQLLQYVLNFMNSSFDHSKANIDQSKLSLQNSKLQQQFYGSEAVQNKLAMQLMANNSKNVSQPPIYVLETQKKQRMQHSKNSKRESDHVNFELSYSQQSLFEESLQNANSKIAQNRHEMRQNEIRVLEEEAESNICMYCQQSYQFGQKQHYINECKVLIYCQKCSSVIYIRQFTDHLLSQCEKSFLHKQCKKCGLAFEIGQINEHIGKDTCKKKLGVNWQRCQFCGSDILGEDKFWIEHALQCNMLPDKKNFNNREESYQEEDHSIGDSK